MQPAYGTKKWATSRVSAFRDGIPAPDTSGIVTPPPPPHYSVQFNETDLAYLARRFEEGGLFFWFSHEDGKHRLHVADTANGSAHHPRHKAPIGSKSLRNFGKR